MSKPSQDQIVKALEELGFEAESDRLAPELWRIRRPYGDWQIVREGDYWREVFDAYAQKVTK